MPQNEKKDFMKNVVILVDTREQKNDHIISVLDGLGVQHMQHKLDYGDYSFVVNENDFQMSCVVERKAHIDEVYGNITSDRERIEKELATISKNATQCVFLLENCTGWDFMKEFTIPHEQMEQQGRKVQNIGATVYSTLQAWQCGNRYNFRVEFSPDIRKSAIKMLEIFFWYWHNYKQATAARDQMKG